MTERGEPLRLTAIRLLIGVIGWMNAILVVLYMLLSRPRPMIECLGWALLCVLLYGEAKRGIIRRVLE